jgi:hypothetical protein
MNIISIEMQIVLTVNVVIQLMLSLSRRLGNLAKLGIHKSALCDQTYWEVQF